MNKTIYALGFFDGVHIGHAALLKACREMAEKAGLHCGAVTFDVHPEALVHHQAPVLLNAPRDRELLLRERFSMQTVVTLPFDDRMRSMYWVDFLEMLRREYGAAGFVCGDDFRFGYRGQGTAALLAEYCREHNLPCTVVPEQTLDGIRVSSTYIRSQIETGDMATAVRFLGHPHILRGTVVPGKQLGRTLGVPTANLRLIPGMVKKVKKNISVTPRQKRRKTDKKSFRRLPRFALFRTRSLLQWRRKNERRKTDAHTSFQKPASA